MVYKCTRYFIILIFCFGFGIGNSLAEDKDSGSTQEIIAKKISSDLVLKINTTEYKLTSSDASKWVQEKTDLAFVPDYFSEIENTNYCTHKKSLICALTFSNKNGIRIKKISQISLDKSLIEKFIANLANTINKDPEDAKFKIADGKVSVFSLDKKGLKLKEDESLEILINYFNSNNFSNVLDLPYEETDPRTEIGSVDNMGITELVGQGRSNFKGSPKNRIFNIKVATSRFDGILIKPNEEFSFVQVLGEVDGEHGYLPELVIKKDKTEPEFGGGICQVSTTAFRAAINSGLEITARRNHAYPVSYYNPQGMDATVYVPRPDLKFINNTPNYILIQTRVEGTELFFDFYGTNDGRKVEVIGPTVTEKNADGSMKTTFTQKVYNKNGDLIREDVFKSSYDSPSKYPHPGTTNDILTQKPNGWSDREWKEYKKSHGI